ncbi:MAG: hypothetical protein HKN91_17145 [Acidimicrobiia bacterium]|nr:hypothetical protein [Acidimicrobiia bacterium]
MKIVSVSRAKVDEAVSAHIYAAWSNLVTLERPAGLAECFLFEDDGVFEIMGVWETREDHDAALAAETNHPAFVVFEAGGVECTHTFKRLFASLHN